MAADDRPVLILGAGINGAALARELALNRVPVCVVDTADLAGGTTAYSSRLIHGGLRYLEYGEFDLVRESLEERNRLLHLAPHLVHPLRLFIPVANRWGGIRAALPRFLGWRSKGTAPTAPRGLWLVRMGLWLYDKYARSSTLPGRGVHRAGDAGVPSVDASRFRWMCSYFDAQVRYPELLTLAMLEDARDLARENQVWFRVFTYHEAHVRGASVEVRRLQPTPDEGQPLQDQGQPVCSIKPAAIVNATGAWVDHTLQRLHVDSPQLIGGTKGSHLLVRHERLRTVLDDRGIYVEAADGRPVFILPLGQATLVGTTDLPFEGNPRQVTAGSDEVEYLLATVNQVIPSVDVQRQHVDTHFCGVRPLPCTPAGSPASVTRRHWLEENPSTGVPLFSVIGGKLTTCRSLAEQATRTVLSRIGRNVIADSRERPFPGGQSYPDQRAAIEQRHRELAGELGLSPEQVCAVWELCGTRTSGILAAVLHEVAGDGGSENLPGTALPCSFVRWVIRNQWVTTLSDLVERRLMLLFKPDLSEACLRRLAELLVSADRLTPDDIGLAVQQCRHRLHEHFGKRVCTTTGRE